MQRLDINTEGILLLTLSFAFVHYLELHWLLALPCCLLLSPQQFALLELSLAGAHALKRQFLKDLVLDHAPNQYFG